MTTIYRITRTNADDRLHDYAVNATSNVARRAIGTAYATAAEADAAFARLPKRMREIHRVEAVTVARENPTAAPIPVDLREVLPF